MTCVDNFSWVLTEWKMHQHTIADADNELMSANDQYAAYVIRCIDSFNAVTFHLATLPIRTTHELHEALAVIEHLNNDYNRDDYAEPIDGLLKNIRNYLTYANPGIALEPEQALRLVA
jgi:hypothetical protein